MNDFRITRHGSSATFMPLTDEAAAFASDHLGRDAWHAQRYGFAIGLADIDDMKATLAEHKLTAQDETGL